MVEVETDLFLFNAILEALPAMAVIVREDAILKILYDAMTARVCEIYPKNESEEDIEKILVCGFSKQI